VVEYFKPQRVILFGSRARGEATRDSDIDLLVVVDDDSPCPSPATPAKTAPYLLWVPSFELEKECLLEALGGARLVILTGVIPGWPEGPGLESMNTGQSLALAGWRS
jgi:hypothetical protein